MLIRKCKVFLVRTTYDSHLKWTLHRVCEVEGTHCLYRDLNDKRPGASSDNNFIFKKINEN